MPSRDYHEALWERVPEGVEPPDFASAPWSFLLAHVGRRASACWTSAAAKGGSRPSSPRAELRVVGIDVAEEPLRRARERDTRSWTCG